MAYLLYKTTYSISRLTIQSSSCIAFGLWERSPIGNDPEAADVLPSSILSLFYLAIVRWAWRATAPTQQALWKCQLWDTARAFISQSQFPQHQAIQQPAGLAGAASGMSKTRAVAGKGLRCFGTKDGERFLSTCPQYACFQVLWQTPWLFYDSLKLFLSPDIRL